ncbi:MAG: (2Fe-2S)-binding protein [Pseudomonadota bacterium]
MGSEKITITLTVNGEDRKAKVYPMTRLLDLLREEFKLTGTKEGCGEGECGACAVIVNGDLVNSCLIPAIQVDGADIVTIEGVAGNQELDPIQQSFLEMNATQCGFCTPGMVMATAALLMKNKKPNTAQIQEALSGNLCRCTGHVKIFEAVKKAARTLK